MTFCVECPFSESLKGSALVKIISSRSIVVQERSESLPRLTHFAPPNSRSLGILSGCSEEIPTLMLLPTCLTRRARPPLLLTFLCVAPAPSSEWAQRRCFFAAVS